MKVIRLRACDGSLAEFDADWRKQCAEVDEDYGTYGEATTPVIRDMAGQDSDREWAIAIKDAERFMAAACAIRTIQKPFPGWSLRIRHITMCPLLDYGNVSEKFYADTLIAILDGAIKLSESDLQAEHIKLHLRSPNDAMFFRSFGHTLDSRGVFAATEAHGSWLTLSKAVPLQMVK